MAVSTGSVTFACKAGQQSFTLSNVQDGTKIMLSAISGNSIFCLGPGTPNPTTLTPLDQMSAEPNGLQTYQGYILLEGQTLTITVSGYGGAEGGIAVASASSTIDSIISAQILAQ